MLATTTATAVAEGTAIGFYLVYAAVAIGLVVYLARTLRANGEVFLRDVFEDSDLAGAVNHLLVIGFYLLNLGYAFLLYRLQASYDTLIAAFNDLVTNLGWLLLSLGVIHLINMFVFWRIRNHRHSGVAPPVYTPPAPAPPPPAPITPNPAPAPH